MKFFDRYFTETKYGVRLNTTKVVAHVVVVLAFLMVGSGSFYINSEYQHAVVTKLGKLDRIEGPGFHFKIPFVESAYTLDTRMDEYTIQNAQVAMKGGSNVIGLDITINHRRDPSKAAELYSSFGKSFDYEGLYLDRMTQDRAKDVAGGYTIEEFIDARGKVRDEIFTLVREKAAQFGINVVGIQLANFSYSDDYKDKLKDVSAARSRAAIAEQRAREANFAADERENKERGEAEAKKIAAAAEAKRIELVSIQSAAAVEREKLAEAAGIRAVTNALAQQQNLVAYIKAQAELERAKASQNWKGEMPQFMGDGLNFVDVAKLIKDRQ